MIALVALAALAAMVMWLLPVWQVWMARASVAQMENLVPSDRLILENDVFRAENAARATLALILAAGGLLLGLGIVWRRFEISRELKTPERFAQAIEQLASDRRDGSVRTEVRLGGIYALERLLLESERDYWPVMEVLTAYVREHAAVAPDGTTSEVLMPRADVQAILGIIGRRTYEPYGERRLLDLRETDLRGANLSGSRLDGVTLAGSQLDRVDASQAVLSRSNLREVRLAGATLTSADLQAASLSRTNLEGARLNGANLAGADLSGASLHGADLWEADLSGANLKDADLRGADLSAARLDRAILWRADMQGTILAGASLKETHMERANLSTASGLTAAQIQQAYTDDNTVLPLEVQAAARGPAPAEAPPAPPRTPENSPVSVA